MATRQQKAARLRFGTKGMIYGPLLMFIGYLSLFFGDFRNTPLWAFIYFGTAVFVAGAILFVAGFGVRIWGRLTRCEDEHGPGENPPGA